ncbi:MAG: GDSL-type esterase/lipase family protein [Actinomycetota bacterium]
MQEEQQQETRIVILGDELTAAIGDPKALGWVGRVIARTPIDDPIIDIYTSPAPGETSATLLERWSSEVQRRFSPETDNRLVLALSNNDAREGISVSRSRLNVATIIDEARRNNIAVFVVGPPPSFDKSLNYEIEHLATGYEDVCKRRSIPFVDFFHPLVDHEGFNAELEVSPRNMPSQTGYGLMAWLVLNRGWYRWLDLEDSEG